MAARRDELARGLESVRARIVSACADCGRDPGEVSLVVVTKYFPVGDLSDLAALGVRDIGENKDQEASAKLDELGRVDPAARERLRVHFIGQLQTNKAASVAAYADVVHSVDRERLVRALSRGAQRAGREMDVLLQVALSEGEGRGGAAPEALEALADQVAQAPGLRLRGLMAVAPLGGDPDDAFARLARISAGLRATHPEADLLSAGMSGDLEAAIRHGATHLRVGSAILGSRPSTR